MQTMRASRIAYQNRRQREHIRYPAFLLRQVRFIGAPVWLLQGFLLLCAFWLFGFANIGTVSSLAPRHLPVLLGCFAVFIAMTSIPFIGRSAQHKMLETEMATRISIPKLLLTRIFIIGIGNVLLLTVSFLLALGEAYRDVFGYLPQHFGFYPEFTVTDYLQYMASLKGLPKKNTNLKIDELLHQLTLADVRNKHIRKLSGGMQRRT